MQEIREEGEKKEEEGNKAAAAVEEKKDDEKKEEEGGAQEIVLKVDMHCEACARKVARALKGFQGAPLLLLLLLLLLLSTDLPHLLIFAVFMMGSNDKVFFAALIMQMLLPKLKTSN